MLQFIGKDKREFFRITCRYRNRIGKVLIIAIKLGA